MRTANLYIGAGQFYQHASALLCMSVMLRVLTAMLGRRVSVYLHSQFDFVAMILQLISWLRTVVNR